MTHAEIAAALNRLDWSATSAQHQLAVSAAVETLKPLYAKAVERIGAKDAAELMAAFPVIPFPVKPRTCWTVLCHLDGGRWCCGSHFDPQTAWQWIVEQVAKQHDCVEGAIDCVASDDPLYEGDDLVTIDGLPVYRIQHTAQAFPVSR